MWSKLIFLIGYKAIEHISKRIEQKRMREQRLANEKELALRDAMDRFKKYKEMK